MRAQLMTEFIMIVGASVLLLAIVVSVVLAEGGRASQLRHESAVAEQYERIRTEVLAAHLAYDGYATEFAFTPPYRGVSMELEIGNGTIRIESAKASMGGTSRGMYGNLATTSGTITISKENGSVIIT